MIKQQQSYNSTQAAKQFTVKRLLRSAIAAGIVVGCLQSASAQSDLVLPAYPDDTVQLSLPIAPEACLPAPCPVQVASHIPTAKRVATLLGLKKQSYSNNAPQAIPALTIPSFPSTEPTLSAPQFVPDQTASNSGAPTIFRSTSARMPIARVEAAVDTVTLASADESLSQVAIPPALVDEAAEIQAETSQYELAEQESSAEELSSEESLDISLSELNGESLTDIQIPTAPVQEVQQQRLPELVKRHPAMQLHIGGGPASTSSSSTSSSQPLVSSSNNYSLSDSDDSSDSDLPKIKAVSSGANTMNVRIEGEPVVAQAPVVPHSIEVPLVAQQATAPAPAPTLLEPVPQTLGHKSLTDKLADKTADKGTERPPTIGERLEVGLHESSNVETSQRITGMSVEHPDLCQVLKNGERSVSIVGLKTGQTRVALFMTNASGERNIEIRDVVIAGAEVRQADMKALATEIGKSVHRMFPNSRIEVIAEEEGLTVQGYAATEAEAKKIIGLVRRTSLQPVVDRLATYK